MGDFFYGWRRKAGCVTLVMATMVTGAWLRGSLYQDRLQFRIDQHSSLAIHFTKAAMGIECLVETESSAAASGLTLPSGFAEWSTSAVDASDTESESGIDLQAVIPEFTRSRWVTNTTNGGVSMGDGTWITIPHMTSAIPLTLLSAYLILWKPRKRPVKTLPNEPDIAENIVCPTGTAAAHRAGENQSC